MFELIFCPPLSVVGSLVNKGIAIVHLVKIDGEVSGRGVDASKDRYCSPYRPAADPGSLSVTSVQLAPLVARHPDLAVIGPGPDEARFASRLGDGEEDRSVLDAGVVGSQPPELPCHSLLLDVRSGLISDQLWPASVVTWTCWLPT